MVATTPIRVRSSRTKAALAVCGLLGFAVVACVDDSGASSGGGTGVDSGSSGGEDGSVVDAGQGTDTGSSTQDSGSDALQIGDADAGPFTPQKLPGIALWLDSSKGVTYVNTKATSWVDQSGNGNNATIPAGCNGPAQAANSLNSHDTLFFSDPGGVGGTNAGGCFAVADAANLQFGTGDFAIFIVARYTNPPGIAMKDNTATFWSKRSPASPFTGAWLVGNTLSEAKVQFWQQNLTGNQAIGNTAPLNNNTFRRFGGTRRGVVAEVWLDGVVDGSVTLPAADDVSQPGRPVYIGGSPDAQQAWLLGNIAEVVAVKGNLSNAQIGQLDAYFKNKHAL